VGEKYTKEPRLILCERRKSLFLFRFGHTFSVGWRTTLSLL